MQSGLLNDKVEIFNQVISTNDYGETKIDYVFYKSYRAKVEHIGGGKKVSNDEIFSFYQKRFTLRVYADVKETDYIKYDNKFYRILTIDKNVQWQQKVIITELVND